MNERDDETVTAEVNCCGTCGQLYERAKGHVCDLIPAQRRRYHAIISFIADSPEDAHYAFGALAAQVEDGDGISNAECEWIEGLLTVDQAAINWVFGWSTTLEQVLSEVAHLISTTYDMVTDERPVWIEIDDNMIHSNRGSMATELFRAHFNKNLELHEFVNVLESSELIPPAPTQTSDAFDRLFSNTVDMMLDDMKDAARERMMAEGWATIEGDHYVLTVRGLEQLLYMETGEEPDESDELTTSALICGRCHKEIAIGAAVEMIGGDEDQRIFDSDEMIVVHTICPETEG